eukprot:2890228-Rhodomonas_salina.3
MPDGDVAFRGLKLRPFLLLFFLHLSGAYIARCAIRLTPSSHADGAMSPSMLFLRLSVIRYLMLKMILRGNQVEWDLAALSKLVLPPSHREVLTAVVKASPWNGAWPGTAPLPPYAMPGTDAAYGATRRASSVAWVPSALCSYTFRDVGD